MNKPDLTPIVPPVKPEAQSGKWKKRTIYSTILVAILAGLAVLLVTTLSNASFFFLDVDEAVSRRVELGSERFRIQGIIVPETRNANVDIQNPDTGQRVTATVFQIAFNGEVASVIHRGDTGNIFTDCLPVILEGRWVDSGENISAVRGDDYYFSSTEILVKHDNNYIPSEADETYSSQNPERVDEAVGSSNQDPLNRCPQT